MLKGAQALGAGFPFVRLDFYESEGDPLFGEMTFSPGSGFWAFDPIEWDYRLDSCGDECSHLKSTLKKGSGGFSRRIALALPARHRSFQRSKSICTAVPTRDTV